jgi:putative transposase
MKKKRKATKRTLNTLWHIPEDLWREIEELLGPQKQPGSIGRPAVPFRKVLDGILYVLRTGCQWKAVPKQIGSGSTLHRRFQQWVQAGVFRQIWTLLLERYERLRGISWRWQSLDSIMTKAPLGGEKTGPNPTDRAKIGTKRHMLTDGRGAPLAITVTGAQCHDMKAALSTIDSMPIPRPDKQQHLCMDKAYDFPEIDIGVHNRGYRAHTRRRGEGEPPASRKHPARRWVVERTHSWHNRFRRLVVRWEKKADNFIALCQFACALTVYRLIFLG